MGNIVIGFFSFAWLRGLDFLPSLIIRLFMAPVLWVSGSERLGFLQGDVTWYNPMTWFDGAAYDAGVATVSSIGLPSAELMSGVIGTVEVIGALFLFCGFAVRWITLPLLALVGFMLVRILMQGDEGMWLTLSGLLQNHGYNDGTSTMFTAVSTYFIFLLTLFFIGAGRFFSVDYWIYRGNKRSIDKKLAESSLDNDPFDVDATDDH